MTALSEQAYVDSQPAVTRQTADGVSRRATLGIWLQGLRSFFNVRNHPFTEAEQDAVLTRNWANEIRITHTAVLTSSAIALLLETESSPAASTAKSPDSSDASPFAGDGQSDSFLTDLNGPPTELAEALYDISVICESLLLSPSVSFSAWSGVGRLLARELDRSDSARQIAFEDNQLSSKRLQPQLLGIIRRGVSPSALGSDVLIIFSELARLLERLRVIADFLRRDHPLKQTLPIFSVVYEEARRLLDFIETRALRIESMEEEVFSALDSTHYIISLELRKVFTRELAGLSALRQASQIFLKVDAAHGLLRTCFQQSTISVARLFDPALKGIDLFTSIQVDLEQSLILRRDLWRLLQLVRRAQASEAKAISSSPFGSFRDVSLRFLKYRDREEYERFIEKISGARGAAELAPILHSFDAYLETLFGCVNTRAVLANHPFDFSNAEPEPR